MKPEFPLKHDAVQALMAHGVVRLVILPKSTGCLLPDHLLERDAVALDIGVDMPIPIRDLTVDHFGVRGTLSFNRRPFACVVPWAAVVGAAVVGKCVADFGYPKSESAKHGPARAQAQKPEQKPASQSRVAARAKRELPPYLRVVK